MAQPTIDNKGKSAEFTVISFYSDKVSLLKIQGNSVKERVMQRTRA